MELFTKTDIDIALSIANNIHEIGTQLYSDKKLYNYSYDTNHYAPQSRELFTQYNIIGKTKMICSWSNRENEELKIIENSRSALYVILEKFRHINMIKYRIKVDGHIIDTFSEWKVYCYLTKPYNPPILDTPYKKFRFETKSKFFIDNYYTEYSYKTEGKFRDKYYFFDNETEDFIRHNKIEKKDYDKIWKCYIIDNKTPFNKDRMFGMVLFSYSETKPTVDDFMLILKKLCNEYMHENPFNLFKGHYNSKKKIKDFGKYEYLYKHCLNVYGDYLAYILDINDSRFKLGYSCKALNKIINNFFE